MTSVRKLKPLLGIAILSLTAGPVLGQSSESPPRLSAVETGCDTSRQTSRDTTYEFDAVDQPVEAEPLSIKPMPLRVREVLKGRTVLGFVVEPSGRIDRCSIELVEEDSPEWTSAVLKELQQARYQPARREGRKVRQRVYQIFTYHHDGRFLHGQ